MKPQGKSWSYHTTHLLPATLLVCKVDHHPQPIQHLNPHEGVAVVGVIQALYGNQKPALVALQAKATKWEMALCKGFLPHHLAWMALHWVIWPSL